MVGYDCIEPRISPLSTANACLLSSPHIPAATNFPPCRPMANGWCTTVTKPATQTSTCKALAGRTRSTSPGIHQKTTRSLLSLPTGRRWRSACAGHLRRGNRLEPRVVTGRPFLVLRQQSRRQHELVARGHRRAVGKGLGAAASAYGAVWVRSTFERLCEWTASGLRIIGKDRKHPENRIRSGDGHEYRGTCFGTWRIPIPLARGAVSRWAVAALLLDRESVGYSDQPVRWHW